jgi:protein-S-isoprenylcysteine O-methyltransferase Ste14
MNDTADTANVIIRPPIAWALAVLAGLALQWIVGMPFMPASVPVGWIALVIRYGVVAREEVYLELKFGDAYRHYRARVRRWL